MSSQFPANLDTPEDPVEGQYLDNMGSIGHIQTVTNIHDMIEALEAKVGKNSSAVTTSHDYKLSGVTGSDKAVSMTGSETLTNKILTSPTLNTPTFSAGAVGTADIASSAITQAKLESDLKAGWSAFNQTLTYNASGLTGTGFLIQNEVGDKIKICQPRSQAYTNDPASGSNITLNMTSTSQFNVGNKVLVSSSAGSEVAKITVVNANTSIVVDTLALNHTTTTPLVYIGTDTLGTKYFNVTSVTNVLLGITGGTDYTLENATITSPYYSHSNPVGFPANSNTFSPLGVAYAQITTTFTTTTASSDVDVTNLAITITVPTGKRIRLTTNAEYMSRDTSADFISIRIKEGATASCSSTINCYAAAARMPVFTSVILSPTAGAHTYKVSVFQNSAGTFSLSCGAIAPAYIMAEIV